MFNLWILFPFTTNQKCDCDIRSPQALKPLHIRYISYTCVCNPCSFLMIWVHRYVLCFCFNRLWHNPTIMMCHQAWKCMHNVWLMLDAFAQSLTTFPYEKLNKTLAIDFHYVIRIQLGLILVWRRVTMRIQNNVCFLGILFVRIMTSNLQAVGLP